MQAVSFKRHRFPPNVIRQTVRLYFRFTLSLRNIKEMQAERGIEATYETVRCWSLKLGRLFAQNLRRSRPIPTGRRRQFTQIARVVSSCRARAGTISTPSTGRMIGNNRAENSHLVIRRRERKQQKF